MGSLVEVAIEPRVYLAELHESCIAAVDETMTGIESFKYVTPMSLGFSTKRAQRYSSIASCKELAQRHGLGGVLRVKLTFGFKAGWHKTLCLSGTWELVSAEGVVVAKVCTKQLSEQRYNGFTFINAWDPKYKPIYMELARKNAQEFVALLTSPPDTK